MNKDRVLEAMFNLPRMQLGAEDPPGTPTTLQVCAAVLPPNHIGMLCCIVMMCRTLQEHMNILGSMSEGNTAP